MSAQLGSAVTLTYWEQAAQQAGGSVQLSYSPPPAVSRKLVGDFGAPWASSAPRTLDTRAVQVEAQSLQIDARAEWQDTQPLNAASRQPWGVAQVADAARHAAWLQFAGRPLAQSSVPWGLSSTVDHASAHLWREFENQLARQAAGLWGVAAPRDAERHGPWGQFASHLARSAAAAWSKPAFVDQERWNPWNKFSRTLQPPWVVLTPPVDPGEDPVALFYILPARFYMTAHTIFAQRLPDLADIPIFDATVAADAGSFCWTLSASGPASLFDLISPVDGLPVQLRVTLDGIPFVFAVDALSRSQKFGQTGVSISGRSVTALIGAPYLRAVGHNNTEPRLAQQLALDALTNTGVGLDWGLVDWTVPAGAWSHQGTPLDAVQAIAQAAGGYLQSHRSAATLLARHPYSQRAGDQPGAPWGWMTGPADVELAPDAIILEGTERRDGADLNAVYVSGTTQGVLAQVKRTGTAGDKLAAMVTDALITDAIAARQRGLAILGAAGKKYHVRLELPVLTGLNQPGVLDVGQLVQVNATTPWRGRVQSVSVSAKRPSIRQTITLERHLETL